jgi:hypothetical protein
MLLITNFLELRVVTGRRRKLAGRQHAVCGGSMLIHIYHAVPMLFPCRHPAATLPRPCRGNEKSLSESHIRGMAGEWQGNGIGTAWERNGKDIVCVNQTRPHCVNQMGMTQSKPLAEGHGRRTEWERHSMCESDLKQWRT